MKNLHTILHILMLVFICGSIIRADSKKRNGLPSIHGTISEERAWIPSIPDDTLPDEHLDLILPTQEVVIPKPIEKKPVTEIISPVSIETKRRAQTQKMIDAFREEYKNPTRAFDNAFLEKNWSYISYRLKQETKEMDEPTTVLKYVEMLEGKHLDIPEYYPKVKQEDAFQALIIRKALRHKYKFLKYFDIPRSKILLEELKRTTPNGYVQPTVKILQAESYLEYLIDQLAELDSVDTVLHFTDTDDPTN